MLPLSRTLPIPIALAFLAPSELGFRPAKGSTWTKTFTRSSEMHLEEFLVEMQGAPVPSQYLPEMEITITDAFELIVVDRYHELAAGRPRRLSRKYVEIATSATSTSEVAMAGMTPETEDLEAEGTSGLAGREVEFVWDEARGEYEARWAGNEGGGDELLAELGEDLDLRALLPGGEVAQGDSWTVPAETFAEVLYPGGELGIELEGDPIDHLDPDYEELTFSGEATLRLGKIEEGVAAIEIEGEIEHRGEMEGDLSHVPVVDGAATQVDTVRYALEGVLEWDVAAGMARSLAVEARVTVASVTSKDEDDPQYEHRLVFRGRTSFAMRCRAGE